MPHSTFSAAKRRGLLCLYVCGHHTHNAVVSCTTQVCIQTAASVAPSPYLLFAGLLARSNNTVVVIVSIAVAAPTRESREGKVDRPPSALDASESRPTHFLIRRFRASHARPHAMYHIVSYHTANRRVVKKKTLRVRI